MDNIYVKVGSFYKKITLNDIDYIYYEDRYANIVVADNIYPINSPMKDLATSLPDDAFIQTHQSYIVNSEKIEKISFANNQIDMVGKIIPIGSSFKKKLQEKFDFFQ